ncbi:MAG: hypothetical protein MZV63_22600 [Marinilabiliales bacterium]|nr:hypothetical protein [Marinilabiliales bacterium]
MWPQVTENTRRLLERLLTGASTSPRTRTKRYTRQAGTTTSCCSRSWHGTA